MYTRPGLCLQKNSTIFSLRNLLVMNRLYPLLFVVVLCSCLGYKELPVEYDYSYHGNFKKYRTYDLMKPIGFSDSTMSNETIEKSILSRMKFLGYKKSDHRPHL